MVCPTRLDRTPAVAPRIPARYQQYRTHVRIAHPLVAAFSQPGHPERSTAYGHHHKLRRLTGKAVRVLETNMDSDDGALAQRAAETVLAYSFGKPRQQSEVTVNVVNPAQAHYAALQDLAQRAANRAASLNPNPLNSLGLLAENDKLPIKHAPVIEGELIPLPANSADKSSG